MLTDNFIYGVPRSVLNQCNLCEAKTFYYTAHGLTWSYCTLCRVFYTPHRKRDISRFLAAISKELKNVGTHSGRA